MDNEELMNKKEELKEQFKDEINKIIKLDNESYNIFSILGYNSKELKHSRFMRWLLSFNAFFERFTKACGINVKSDSTRKINLEETYNLNDLSGGIPISNNFYEENKKGRRIDINIISDARDFSITIENKVDTGEHNDQCISYYNYMMNTDGKYNDITNKFFVFLTKEVPNDFSYFGGLIPDGKKYEELDDRYYQDDKNDKNEYNKELYEKVYKETDGKRKMKFFNYRLITYKDVLKILEEDKTFINDLESEVEKRSEDEAKSKNWDIVQKNLKQFMSTIEEWYKLGGNYIKIINGIIADKTKNSLFYYAVENLKELKEGEDESDFGRFLEVVDDYCDEMKRKTDKYIKPVLEAIISDNTTIKTDYGRGNYAYAIPITIDHAGDYDKLRFICTKIIADEDKDKKYELLDLYYNVQRIKAKKLEDKLKKYQKELNDKLNEYLNKIKAKLPNIENPMLKTVDFRAPMGGSQFITIGVFAGLKSDFSKNLCDYVLADGFKKINDYKKAHTKDVKDVKVTWTYKVKDGGAYSDDSHKIYEVNIDLDKFHKCFPKNMGCEECKKKCPKLEEGNDKCPKLKECAKSYVGRETKVKDDDKKEKEKTEDFIKRLLINELVEKGIIEKAEFEKIKGNIISYFSKDSDNYKKSRNSITCIWTMGITFELKDIPVENGNINDMQALAEQFYNTTIEAMELFGYADYFKNHIFKPDADRKKAIESLKNGE